MMTGIGTILIAIAVIFVTAMLFIGWTVFSLIRALIRLIAPACPPRLAKAVSNRFTTGAAQVRCSRDKCRNFNPPVATFCRCCGAKLETAPTGWRIRRPIDKRMWA
ncbi:hypothetical protein BH10PLA1_BH10PLA1_18090 [soil metagenome]